MVSTRGVKFKFSEGERVLCYEPDPTKAKVLYESKVLDLVVSRDSRGRKVPEYMIHFFGWNSSWDRCVSEEFILRYTEQNKNLQAKLAKDAAVTLKGKRRTKLPPLIKETLAKKVCVEDGKEESNVPEDPLDSFSSESDTSEDEMEPEVIINIPDDLKQVMEEDWRNITQRDKFVKLPCEVNVITILENYVKYRAANMLCAAPYRNGNNGMQLTYEDVGNTLNLCKEAVDGLRICFDFTLPHLLLYRQEKKQYYTIGTSSLPFGVTICNNSPKNDHSKIKKEIENGSPPMIESQVPKELPPPKIEPETSPPRPQRGRPPLRNQPVRQSQPTNQSQQVSETVTVNGNLPAKLRNKIKMKKSIIQKSKKGKNSKPVTTRILRSNDKPKSTEPASSAASTPPTITTPQSPQPEDTILPRPKSPTPPCPRLTRKSVLNSSPPCASTSIQVQLKSSPTEKVPSNSSTSQPCSQLPSLLPVASNSISSSASSTHSGPSSPTLNEQQCCLIHKSGLLQEVLSWQMLPQEHYYQVPAAPSLVYGSQHLLRLFVKLPDLISKMAMARKKIGLLLNILDHFLYYLAEQKDALFHPSAYIDCKDVFPDSNVIVNK